jgi:DNA polymerase I
MVEPSSKPQRADGTPATPVSGTEPSSKPRGTLLLVDGSSYLYRAFHAMPNLTSKDGFPTGAIHGIVAMLKRLRSDVQPVLAACVFDAKGKTFRDDWYPAYKATRSSMPEPLAQQIAPIHEVVKHLGWPILEVPGIEADDVIGTLARLGTQQGFQVLISTGDKDLAQLVNEHVTLLNTMSNETLDVPGVQAKFGVHPERIVDYLTLVGDTVDNVPGVEKVGPKTAVKWLEEHGSLDAIVAAADSFKGATGDNLRKALDWLPMGRKLVTVVTDCDLAAYVPAWPALDTLAMQNVNADALLDFYKRFDFRTWTRELEAGAVAAPATKAAKDRAEATETHGDLFAETPNAEAQRTVNAAVSGQYETILTLQALDAWIQRLRAAPLVAVDTETDSLDPMRARMVGISFAVQPLEAAYVPVGHDAPDAPAQLPLAAVLARLRPWLEDASAAKVGQNIKYDLHVFENHGIHVKGYAHDTMLQSYVLDAHLGHSLEKLAERHLGRRGLSYEELCGKGVHQIPFSQVDVPRATQYSGEDSEMTLAVQQALAPRIAAEPGFERVYQTMEMPACLILQRIERHGVLVDSSLLAQQSGELAARMSQLEQTAYELAGQPFNLGSPKQIGEILFGKLGLPVKKKTASGAPSTDEEVLQELSADYPLPATLLQHRSLSKLKSTYTDKLPLMVNAVTGRVHTNYAQAVAVTGRLASNDPNLQNIPIRTPEGRRVRKAFIAPPGHQLASADYSQIELRIMAHISEDPGLMAAFAGGIDVHKATASEVFGVPLAELTTEQRRSAKAINFGLIYGMGAFGLANNLGIDQKVARNYIERYFTQFAGVKRYMDETKKRAGELGYVETYFGRRIVLPEIKGGSGPRRAGAERQAINAPMQGTAADLIKLAMIAVQAAIDEEKRATRIVMQVHDELVMEVPNDETDWVRERVPQLMASVAQLNVPLVAEIGFGPNWDEAH